ncbi:MAG: DUF4147 domain-containing protein, partial [Alphaproteobacteria bacterium]|nr:DUF4147 domain-containing protein [Alphaproteobacteria bacterium]
MRRRLARRKRHVTDRDGIAEDRAEETAGLIAAAVVPGAFLRELFDAALAAASPERAIAGHLPAPVPGRTVVVGAGKASAAMARAFERFWHGPLEGLVVTRYGHAVACDCIEIVQAAHPVPDAAGEKAAQRILDLARSLGP